jgi:hypothetical protein
MALSSKGHWYVGKRYGRGKFTCAESRSYYAGDFEGGEMHGQGESGYVFPAQSLSVEFMQSS